MTIPLFDLSGRNALVTGGSKGLGLAMAKALAQAGAHVAITARHADELRAAMDSILAETQRRGAWLVGDMARRDEVEALARRRRGPGTDRHPRQQRRDQPRRDRGSRPGRRLGRSPRR